MTFDSSLFSLSAYEKSRPEAQALVQSRPYGGSLRLYLQSALPEQKQSVCRGCMESMMSSKCRFRLCLECTGFCGLNFVA